MTTFKTSMETNMKVTIEKLDKWMDEISEDVKAVKVKVGRIEKKPDDMIKKSDEMMKRIDVRLNRIEEEMEKANEEKATEKGTSEKYC